MARHKQAEVWGTPVVTYINQPPVKIQIKSAVLGLSQHRYFENKIWPKQNRKAKKRKYATIRKVETTQNRESKSTENGHRECRSNRNWTIAFFRKHEEGEHDMGQNGCITHFQIIILTSTTERTYLLKAILCWLPTLQFPVQLWPPKNLKQGQLTF